MATNRVVSTCLRTNGVRMIDNCWEMEKGVGMSNETPTKASELVNPTLKALPGRNGLFLLVFCVKIS